LRSQHVDDRIASPTVNSPKAVHVSGNLTLVEQLRHSGFDDVITARIYERSMTRERCNQSRIGYNITDAQTWSQNLGKSPDIDHNAVTVVTGQRHDRVTVVMKFVIVIVLDNREATTGRDVK
jgi:hypothetical protein